MPTTLVKSLALSALISIAGDCMATPINSESSPQLRAVKLNFQESVSNEVEPNFKIIKSFNFDSPNSSQANDLIKSPSTYPQGFWIDEQEDSLFILRYSNNHPSRAIIEQYTWSTSKLVKTFIIPEPQNSVSESIIVDRNEDGLIAYIRSENKLAKYALINLPGNIGSTKRLEYLHDNVAQSFARFDGRWYLEKYKTHPDNLGQSRGEYTILDSNYKHVGDVSFPASYSGYRESQKLNIPKHQGFAAFRDGFVMSMGGHWTDKSKSTPYHYYGINFFDKTGSISTSNYVSPIKLFGKLEELGVKGDTTENEGIQALNGGRFVVLQVVQTQGKPGGQILFIQFTRR